MDRLDRDTQHLALSTAAALVYFHITGQQLDGKLDEQTRDILCDVARALSVLAPIYALGDEESEMLIEVPPGKLMGSAFVRGAQALVLKDGTEIRKLTIQRKDMHAAVTILKAS